MLVLNSTNNTNNTVTTTTSSSSLPKPPPIPQHPPPAMSSTTNNRININLNPLNSYLDQQQQQQQQHLLSPKIDSNCGGENFYHTLTTLGTLPNDPPLYPATESTGDYTNATLNMHRAHQILLKQQQHQQLIMNTLKTLNYRSKQLQQQQQHGDHHARSPSVGSMKRHTSASSSKRSKKGANKSSNKDVSNGEVDIQQQQHNYYLLPNIRPNQGSIINPIRNIYNGWFIHIK